MKRTNMLVALLCLLASTFAFAQKPSPAETATGKVAGANVTVKYSSPSVKGRKIWGGLVPYGKVWRAGANEPTTFETDKDITIGGKSLPKGKYSLFILPNENDWTLIINSEIRGWGITHSGDADLDRAKDLVVVSVKPKTTAATEKLTYMVSNAGLSVKWDTMEATWGIK